MLLYVDSHCMSPYAMSAFVALQEKKAPFGLRFIDLAGQEHRVAPFSGMSATCRVPLLVDGTFSLSESSAIAEYINETLDGPDLYPGNARERARARQIQAWMRSDFDALRAERTTEVIFSRRNPEPLSQVATGQADLLFQACELWLEEGSQVCGEWSMADVDLTVMLSRLVYNGDPVPDRLKRYVQRQWRRPSLTAWWDLCRAPRRMAD